MELIDFIKALAHENRLRILNLLKEKDLCVCELRNIMNINQSNASRHLAKLKQVDLIEYDKEGQWVYYKINKKQIEEYSFIKKLLEEELDKEEKYNKDIERLRLYQQSEINCDKLDDSDIF